MMMNSRDIILQFAMCMQVKRHPLNLILFGVVSCLILPFVLVEALQNEVCSDGSSEDCVCYSRSIVEYFSEALHIPATVYKRAPHVMFDRIEAFYCYKYTRLPTHILIQMAEPEVSESEMHPPTYLYRRRRKYRAKRTSGTGSSRIRRQVSLGIPSEEKFQEVIALIPESRSHHYAPLGSKVTLQCHGEGANGWEEQGFSGASRKFEWYLGNHQPITAPLVQFDKTTGDLTFHSVRLADTGIYTCVVKSNNEENSMSSRPEMESSRSYNSQLDVIAAPMMWLRFRISYSVDRCRRRELLEIQTQIKDVIHQYVCHFCPVRNISVNCIDFAGGNNEGVKYVELSLILSTVGLENLLPMWDHSSHMCTVECQEEMHTKVLNIMTSSLRKLLMLQIMVQPIDGETTVYTPEPQSIYDDIAIGCPSGFFENYKLCFPCAPGQYSSHGKSECIPCEEGRYQPNPGSSECFSCPRKHSTLGTGSRSQMDCLLGVVSDAVKFTKFHWIITGCCLAALAMISLVVSSIYCWPNSFLGRCFRCTCCRRKKASTDEQSDEKKEELEKLIPEEDGNTNENRRGSQDTETQTEGIPKRGSKNRERFDENFNDNYDERHHFNEETDDHYYPRQKPKKIQSLRDFHETNSRDVPRYHKHYDEFQEDRPSRKPKLPRFTRYNSGSPPRHYYNDDDDTESCLVCDSSSSMKSKMRKHRIADNIKTAAKCLLPTKTNKNRKGQK